MNEVPEIFDGQYANLDLLVGALSDSFEQDPIMNWVIPLTDLYPSFFELLVEGLYLPRGIVHFEKLGRGASLWLPPGEDFRMPLRLQLVTMIIRLIAKKGFAPIKHMRLQGDFFSRYHPKEPHYYLQFIGAKQMHQGQGVGSALLKQGTRICDQEQKPAYLESSNELNVPLYQRHGFEIVDQGEIPGGGPRAWFMWREPQVHTG